MVEENEEAAGEAFDEWVTEGDGAFAVTASSCEEEPTEDGNVIAPEDGSGASGAAGGVAGESAKLFAEGIS